MDENVLQGKLLLVVDDETDLRDIVASELEFMGGKVHQAENISVAKEFLSQHKVDLIVSDIRMPGGTGIDLLDHIKAQDVNEPPIMLITGFADITTQQAFDRGAEALMNKPFKLDDLIQVAARLTGPLESRFQVDDFTPSKKLELTLNASVNGGNDFALGRGGCAVCFHPEGKKYEINDVLDFSITLSERKLAGVGTIRWVHYSDNHDGRMAIGLEFMKLDSETLPFVLENFKNKNTKALIPSL